MSRKPHIYFFVKTFQEASYAEAFLNGLLYMNSLAYFVKLEESGEPGRGDRNEGTVDWLQPDKMQFQFNGFQINSSEIVAPVSIQDSRQLAKNVFCMHAGYIGGTRPSEFTTTSDFEQSLRIPEENIILGDHSVLITHPQQFLKRVYDAVTTAKNISMRTCLVDYYDPATLHAHFTDEDAPFKKHQRFSHQREYRIAIERGNGDQSPFELNIGSLSDIALDLPIEVLNKYIKITPRNDLV